MSGDPAFLNLDKARWRLTLLWFPLCGMLVLLLIAQSVGGVYGSEVQRAWGWLARPSSRSARAQSDAERRLGLLDQSNLWLAPLQSLVVASIGVLFFLKEPQPAPE